MEAPRGHTWVLGLPESTLTVEKSQCASRYSMPCRQRRKYYNAVGEERSPEDTGSSIFKRQFVMLVHEICLFFTEILAIHLPDSVVVATTCHGISRLYESDTVLPMIDAR